MILAFLYSQRSASVARASEEDGAPAAGDEASAKKKKKDAVESSAPEAAGDGKDEGKALEIRGRVFAAAVWQTGDYQNQSGMTLGLRDLTLDVPSARLGVRARILDGVSLVTEADFAGKPKLKDGFVQAKSKRGLARAGQFKIPFSVFNVESPWTLPLARRGWLHELLSDHMLLFGRRRGVMGHVTGGGHFDPTLTVGAFHSVRWRLDQGDPAPMRGPSDLTVVARASATPGPMEIAVVAQRRVTIGVDKMTGYWSAGAEYTADLPLEAGGLRVWAEAYLGGSWLAYKPEVSSVVFATGRALAAYRFGGLEKGEPYFEVFATAGALDPDTKTVSDLFYEVAGGVNVGHWRRTRLTFQIEHDGSQQYFPSNFFFPVGLTVLKSNTAAVLQVGAAF